MNTNATIKRTNGIFLNEKKMASIKTIELNRMDRRMERRMPRQKM